MLPLPDKFKKDINSRVTSVHPLVVIGWDITLNSPLGSAVYISQVKGQLNLSDGSTQFLEDANLKISSIRENINIESRKFNINNISITLSNYDNFSDRLAEVDLMNKNVAVFWKSQSAKSLDDCLLVYIAIIKRYDHDEKTIRIQLEDQTQDQISKDVPIANLGTGERVYSDDYNNRYIPIAYGQIPYAPAVIWPKTQSENPDNEDSGFYVISDDESDNTLVFF